MIHCAFECLIFSNKISIYLLLIIFIWDYAYISFIAESPEVFGKSKIGLVKSLN